MSLRENAALWWVPILLLSLASEVSAQQKGFPLHGRLYDSVTTKPVVNALVFIEELQRETKSSADGSFSFEGLPPGAYHLIISAQGFMPGRTEAVVAAKLVSLDIPLNPELHFTEVVSVSPEPRSQFESYQPTSVLQGQELARDLRGTLGAVLDGQPGVAERSFGPAPARPVIRGLDGDRVLILQDGQRMGDLSSQSGDHGVVVNPAAASRLEVVRGPATLLYGANAIGGLVNVITDTIQTERVSKMSGTFILDLGSAAGEAGGAGNVKWGRGSWVLRGGGSGRRSGDVRTPEGAIANSQARAGFGDVGLSWVGSKGYIGGSYGYDSTRYGIPVVEGGTVELTPRRQAFDLRAEGQNFDGVITSARVSLAVRRYEHDEIDAGRIQTTFANNTTELEVHAHHRAVGRLKGTFGIWGLTRAFSATGAEALSPPVDQRGVAAFVYEEISWPKVVIELGGRFDHTGFTPEGGLPDRTFDNVSGSAGLLLKPTPAFTIATSVARAVRSPALEELYFHGPHPGNFAYEIGNPNLASERAFGFDLSLRWRQRRTSGEITYFRNAIDRYILRDPTGESLEGYPVVVFVGRDSLLQGFEAHADVALTPWLFAQGTVDYVHGEVKGSGEPLPRIPPLRFLGGIRYQKEALQIGGEVTLAATQDRVFREETPTEGYQLLKLYAAYSFPTGRTVHTITARVDNASDELYRNHLSYIKDFVPEMGRNFKVGYAVAF